MNARTIPSGARGAAIAIGVLAIAIATRTTITSSEWIGRPFPGFVFTKTRVIAAVSLPHWSAAETPELYLRRIVAVDGQAVRSAAEITDEVRSKPAGTTIRYTIQSDAGEREVALPTEIFTTRDWLLFFGSYLLNGVVFLVSGLLAWVLRPRSPLARAFLAFGGVSALFLFTAMDLYGPSTFYLLYLLANALVPATALDLALLFPEPHRLARWRWVGYPLGALVFGLYLLTLDLPELAGRIFVANTVYLGLVGLFFGSRLVVEYWRGRSGRSRSLARQRLRVITVGTLLGLTLPGVILVAASILGRGVGMNSLLFAFFVFPLSLAYAIVKHDLFDIDATVKRAAYYLLLTGTVGIAYAVAVLVFQLVLRSTALISSPAFPVLFTLAVLLLFDPLRSRLQTFVDRVFFHTTYDAARLLASIGAQLAGARRRDRIVALVRDCVEEAIPNRGTRLFLDASPGQPPRDSSGGEALPPALAAELSSSRVLTAFDAPEAFVDTSTYEGVRKSFAELGSEIAVPMQLGGQIVGALLVGEKRSGLFYTAGDAEFLRALVQEAAIALENAASYEDLAALNASLEQRVQQRTMQLETANADLELTLADLKNAEVKLVQSEKMASLGRLAAGIAHEINNPVSFIASTVEPLKARLGKILHVPPERAAVLVREAERLVGIMGDGADRTVAIVKDLSSFSRLNEAKRKAIDLSDGLEVTVRLLEPRWRDRVTIHRDYGELPEIECNAGQINQVFMNLLANALDAIDGKGNIWLSARADDAAVTIAIRDDGRGIPAEMIDRVFDPFFTMKDVGAGTGLGLAIVHGIIAGHHGRVEVESTRGSGTTFRVVIPIRTPAGSADRVGAT